MIFARLTPATDQDGNRFLHGQTLIDVPAKTLVILKKRGDRYELIELGERKINTDPETIHSFAPEPKS